MDEKDYWGSLVFMKIKDNVTRFTTLLKMYPDVLPRAKEIWEETKIQIDSAALIATLDQMNAGIDNLLDDKSCMNI